MVDDPNPIIKRLNKKIELAKKNKQIVKELENKYSRES